MSSKKQSIYKHAEYLRSQISISVTLKKAVAILGIACQLGVANAGTSTISTVGSNTYGVPTSANVEISATQTSSSTPTPTSTHVEGASAPGISTTTYARPNDSTTGVTQAVSADKGMACGTGYVLSGGACVALSSLIPAPTQCGYGKVLSGGSCIDLPVTPPVTNCPSGTVLSGGSCVAFQGCSTTPATQQQTLPCATGYTGAIGQAKTPVACNSSTGFAWTWSSWTTTSNSCVLTPTCPAQPAVTQEVYGCPSGQTGTVTQSRTATCSAATGYSWAMGSWYTSSTSNCAAAPLASCSANGQVSWGAGCSAMANVTTASGSSAYLSNSAAGYSGNASYLCTNGTWGAGPATCIAIAQPSPEVGCAATTKSWTTGPWTGAWATTCSANLPSANSGASSSPSVPPIYSRICSTRSGTGAGVDVLYSKLTASVTAQCSNGSWTVNSSSCNSSYVSVLELWASDTNSSTTYVDPATGTPTEPFSCDTGY